jgi:hypothetical protein
MYVYRLARIVIMINANKIYCIVIISVGETFALAAIYSKWPGLGYCLAKSSAEERGMLHGAN